jgi:hypothetical protein
MAARKAVFSEGQLAMLAGQGKERQARVGDVLFRIGGGRDLLMGEAAVLTASR